MSHQGLRVLLVEDRPEFAETLGEALQVAGHEVEIAPDGASGLEAARVRNPDVVFFELALPGLDGYAVAKGIQDQFAWKRPLLVALTGPTDPDSARRSQEAGIDLLLSKPVDLVLLRNLLRRFQSIVQDIQDFDPGL